MNKLNCGGYVFIKFQDFIGFIKLQKSKDKYGNTIGKVKQICDMGELFGNLVDVVNGEIIIDANDKYRLGMTYPDRNYHYKGNFYDDFEIITPENIGDMFDDHRDAFEYLKNSAFKNVQTAYNYLIKILRDWAINPENMEKLENKPELLACVLGL